jgi:hypothetical protein
MTESSINLAELGCVDKGEEFYTDLEHKFKSMDELDKSRAMLHFSSMVLSENMKLHPVIIMKLMENIQNCEINCAKIKKILGEVKVDGITCKHCNHKMPTMTMRMYCEGVNAKCPHNDVEIEIKEETN